MMSKKLFVLLILLMSLALIGIIFVQAYFISNSIETKEGQFEFTVKKVLSSVSKTIEDKEYAEYAIKYQDIIDEGVTPDTTAIKNLWIIQEDASSNETLIYRNGILEENYKLSSPLFDIGLDSIDIKRVINEQETRIFNNVEGEPGSNLSTAEQMLKLSKLSRTDKTFFESAYQVSSARIPIYKRVSDDEIEDLLADRLKQEGIDIDYEFAIYSNDLATKVQSDNFEIKENETYSIPIFKNPNSRIDYNLLVNFPEHNKYILSSVIGVTLLSIAFTLIIIVAYTSTLYQLVKQRKISEIKTDFINNMTHEFKTPIATINLALDSIKNPKIMENNEKVQWYLGMIREENKRMHAQVENVLRISKLEKNDLNISKERVKLHDIIEDAITHVQLIVEDRKGYIEHHFDAAKSSVLANESHFTNVIVNILDNAIKYSPDAPKIDVYTENVGNNIILKIKDQGSGMSKAAQKRVFEKFYREHTGNVHNVKGHGLGLAYVKRIVDDHHGHVSVESEKEKGSTFIIKLPLIS
ncbi:MAG TPA: HAMP domain-containing sensor histidine kinase [Flavobacteriaceae bacterium]|nr:HAMP domain-containing sensor histidine kinase [Flavobacteriaceae bacterium]